MRCWTRWRREAAQGWAAASIPSTRTVDGASGAGDGPPPQLSTSEGKSGGRAERGGGPRAVRSSTETGLQSRRGAVTDGYVAALVPSLAVPLLAGGAGEAVDDTALSYLLMQSLTEEK